MYLKEDYFYFSIISFAQPSTDALNADRFLGYTLGRALCIILV